MKSKCKDFSTTMNKENMFHDNQPSTDIQDSCSKSYSSRYLLKKKKVNFSQVLPSRYEKAALTIQRFWRFKQSMRRKYYAQILQNTRLQNECYELENSILIKNISQYQKCIQYSKKIQQIQLKSYFKQVQDEVTQVIKKCVAATFKMQKKKPSPQIFQALMDEKQLLRERNFQLNREKMLFRCRTHEEMKRQQEIYLRQIKELSIQHLEIVKRRNQLQKQYKENLLQTSKFGVNYQKSFQETIDLDGLNLNLNKKFSKQKQKQKKREIQEIFNDFDQCQ